MINGHSPFQYITLVTRVSPSSKPSLHGSHLCEIMVECPAKLVPPISWQTCHSATLTWGPGFINHFPVFFESRAAACQQRLLTKRPPPAALYCPTSGARIPNPSLDPHTPAPVICMEKYKYAMPPSLNKVRIWL